MSKKLEGKIAVITGATSGLALASAKLFVEEGAYVFITGRRQKELDEAVKKIGKNVTGVQGDAANFDDLDRLFATVKKEKGHIDILYASAGMGDLAPLDGITEEHYDKQFDLNVKGTLFTVTKALPLLRKGGSIIMTGSIAGSKGMPHFSVYCASKAAIRSFARSWTMELKDRNIRVNVVSPGPIDTAAITHMPKEMLEEIINSVPMHRLGTPEEVAKAVLFLASDDSTYTTGMELFVDGGAAQV
jgi:NAD(P)-dependent dehydrogenase (short-subunit alcohol dehydrogenase family)